MKIYGRAVYASRGRREKRGERLEEGGEKRDEGGERMLLHQQPRTDDDALKDCRWAGGASQWAQLKLGLESLEV